MSQGFQSPSVSSLQTALDVKADITAVNVANSSYVKTALNASGSAPIYACRAWISFGGTGTPAINASGNVTTITDHGTGDYTLNFTSTLPDAHYSVAGVARTPGIAQGLGPQEGATKTTSAFRFFTTNSVFAAYDFTKVYVQVFR